jgi:hypothetical protein
MRITELRGCPGGTGVPEEEVHEALREAEASRLRRPERDEVPLEDRATAT